MVRRYGPIEASTFLRTEARTPVIGGPFSTGLLSRTVRDVESYLQSNYPPHGVIVAPQSSPSSRVLVWVDGSRRTHVIDVTGEPIAGQVPLREYLSPGPSAEDLLRRVAGLAGGVITSAAIAAGLVVGLAILAQRR